MGFSSYLFCAVIRAYPMSINFPGREILLFISCFSCLGLHNKLSHHLNLSARANSQCSTPSYNYRDLMVGRPSIMSVICCAIIPISLNRYPLTCPGVHLSGRVHLSGGSLVRTFRRFGVLTPRARHSQGDAVLLEYTYM